MSLNSTPSGERIHIGIFGKRNAGKSSIINALTGQDLAIVSEQKGTTTDPVKKAMELLPLGPVVLIDTPGIDDEGELGNLRVEKSLQVLTYTDIAALVVDAHGGLTKEDGRLLTLFEERKQPTVVVFNKAEDLSKEEQAALVNRVANGIAVSAITGMNIQELKELLARQLPDKQESYPLVRDLFEPGDFVLLVVPIDKAAPKGRLILPQQQTIREILEGEGIPVIVKEDKVRETLDQLGKRPRLVITDSQVFAQVAAQVPEAIPLTSFSILFARYKGELNTLAKGAAALENLRDGERVLISEGCTHHRQCNDIGTIKIPGWILGATNKKLQYEFTSGGAFPRDLSTYSLVVHCGGCTLNEREMKHRIGVAESQSIPITNYGILIAKVQNILKRSVELFPEVYEILEKQQNI